MAGKSIIIIGAGLAGLSAGCYARMNGYRARIFENHTLPGGVVAAWRRKGFLIDGGVHFIMGHRPGQSTHNMYRELGIIRDNRFVDLDTYMAFIDEASGKRISVTRDLDRFWNDLKNISPKDSRAIDELASAVRGMGGMDLGLGMDEPPEVSGSLGQIKTMWKSRGVVKYMFGKYAKPMCEYSERFENALVREIISNLFLPEVPVWFILMFLAMHAHGQIGLLEGGSLDFVKGLAKRYRGLGGEITYKAKVEEILVEGDIAVGVRLADGSEHRADVVVSAADGYGTVYKMLGGKYLDKKIEERYRNWKLFRPLLMASYGVSREFPGEPHMGLVKLASPLSVAGEEIGYVFVRIFNHSKRFAPEGKSVIQASIETPWDFWNDLQKDDRPQYDIEKKNVATKLLDCLAEHYPGLSSEVMVTDVATPYTTWRYTSNRRGSYEGWLPTPEAIMTRIEKTLPGLDNFLMAGQWVMPGGGVPPCLYSGRHVIQILCHRDGKSFTASPP